MSVFSTYLNCILGPCLCDDTATLVQQFPTGHDPNQDEVRPGGLSFGFLVDEILVEHPLVFILKKRRVAR